MDLTRVDRLLGQPAIDEELPQAAYLVTDGTVHVATLSASRMVGESSGVAVSLDAGVPPAPLPDTVRLSAGRFDAPVMSDRPRP